MAETLERHGAVRLSLGVCTHVGLHDQTAASQSLPAPPTVGVGPRDEAAKVDGKRYPRPTLNATFSVSLRFVLKRLCRGRYELRGDSDRVIESGSPPTHRHRPPPRTIEGTNVDRTLIAVPHLARESCQSLLTRRSG